MKRLFYTLLCGAVGVCGLDSCSRSRSHDVPAPPAIEIIPVITRVAGLNFETGDEIGVTITRSSSVYTQNARMTYDGEVFTADKLEWYVETDDPASLSAYFPYDMQGAPVTFTIQRDQKSGLEQSDLLSAVKTGVMPTNDAVGMVFRHMMATLRIVLTNETTSSVRSLRVGGTLLSATVDFNQQKVTATPGTTGEIEAFTIKKDQNYQLILVPQTAALQLTVETEDNKVRTFELPQHAFLQGKSYSLSLIVEKERLIPLLSGQVVDWEVGQPIQNETPEEEPDGSGTTSGGTMMCQGESYPTVELGGRIWMAENLHYDLIDDSSVKCKYPGTLNASTLEKYGLLYDYETAVKLCPEGWRLPTEADFEALIAVLEKPYEDFIPLAGNYTTTASNFGMKGYLMGSSEGQAEMRRYLQLTKNQKPVINDTRTDHAVSVRFVKDAQ